MSQDGSGERLRSISHSQFGSFNSILLGDFSAGTVQLNPTREIVLDSEFLKELSALDPNTDRILAEDANRGVNDTVFEWLSDDDTFLQWRGTNTLRVLWVDDETGKGHTLLLLQIIRLLLGHSDLAQQPTFVFPVFCQGFLGQKKDAAMVLKELVYLLLEPVPSLVHDIRKTFGRALREPLGSEYAFPVVCRALRHILAQTPYADRDVFLLVDGLDSLPDELDPLVDPLVDGLAQRAKGRGCREHVKWLVSGRSYSGKPSDNAVGGTIKLNRHQVLDALGLAGILEVIEEDAREINRWQQKTRDLLPYKPDAIEWLKYTKRGRRWLDSTPGSGPPTLWYRTSGDPLPTQTSLGFYVTKMISAPRDEPITEAYISFSDIQNSSSPNHALHSSILWLFFVQLARKCCPSDETLSSFILSLERNAQNNLKNIYLQCTSKALPSEKKIDSAAANKQPSTAEAIGDSAQLRSKVLPFLDKSWAPGMADLLRAVIQSHCSHHFVLVLELFGHTDVTERGSLLQSLVLLASQNHHQCRLLVSGIEGQGDNRGGSSVDSLDGALKAALGVVDEKAEYEDCLEELYFDQISSRRDEVADALPGTNTWLWSNESYKEWNQSGGLLWIQGRPGSGKSVLAKTIQKNFLETAAKLSALGPSSVCDWFYNARGERAGMVYSSMLRALLYQMLRASERSFYSVRQHYRNQFDESSQTFWTYKSLQTMLLAIASCSEAPQTLLIIDALDESISDDGTGGKEQDMLALLSDLASIEATQVRVIALSRPEPEIESKFQRYPQIVMHKQNETDIDELLELGVDKLKVAWMTSVRRGRSPFEENFPRTRYSHVSSLVYSPGDRSQYWCPGSIPQPNPSQREEDPIELRKIQRHLKATAGGVVLWIKLVLQQLQEIMESQTGFSLKDLREMAENLPQELGELYARILEKLDLTSSEKKLRVSRRILLWTLASRSSHPLELQDLWDAIGIPDAEDVREPTDDPIESGRFVISGNWDAFRRIIYAHCGPLVEIIPKEGEARRVSPLQATATIQLLHQTAKTFLEDPARSGILNLQHQDAIDFAKFESLRYLRLVLSPEGTHYAPILRTYQCDEEITRLLNYLDSRPFIRWALRLMEPGIRNDWIQAIMASSSSETQADIKEVKFPLWWLCVGTDLEFANLQIVRAICKLGCELGTGVALEIVCEFLHIFTEIASEITPNQIFDCETTMARGAAEAYLEPLDQNIDIFSPIINDLIEILRKSLPNAEFKEIACKFLEARISVVRDRTYSGGDARDNGSHPGLYSMNWESPTLSLEDCVQIILKHIRKARAHRGHGRGWLESDGSSPIRGWNSWFTSIPATWSYPRMLDLDGSGVY
ncbi:hypothetical protein F5B21DRAFT_471492 [Xylaria acuta]|nr:hypothetical protein F5B21DRAFT_471492 [Xylaria acuta]